jgi:ABC-type multidrug transport system ATPase subunit
MSSTVAPPHRRSTAMRASTATSDGASTAVVRIRGVDKHFGSVQALSGLDLDLARGEVLGLLGRNGAGKTTALRILLGLVRADAGDVQVHGRPPGHPAGLALTGSLVESPAYLPHLSGRDNVRVLARARGLDDAAVDEALDVVGLRGRGGSRYGGYSLGMRQRLGVAGALLGSPDLLVLDEPTNGLDPGGVADMRSLIRELGAAGTTVLLSSHLLVEVEQVCSRVLMLEAGRVIADGTIDELRARVDDRRVEIVARPFERARDCLLRLDGPRIVDPGPASSPTPDDAPLVLEAAPDEVPAAIAALVAAGVDVHEVRRDRHTLEDVFFHLVGEAGRSVPPDGYGHDGSDT